MKAVIHELLQISAQTQRQLAYLEVFPAFALLQLTEGKVERAIEYYAYATSHPFVAKSKWFHDVIGRHIEVAAETLPPEVVAAAQERGRNLDPDKLIKELLIEMEPQGESV